MTKKRKKKLRANDPTAALRKAVNKLDHDQGPVARRNARANVFSEIRRLKAFIDREYPVLRSKAPKPRKRRTGAELYKHLRKKGWVEVSNNSLTITQCAQAGVQVRTVTIPGKTVNSPNGGGHVHVHAHTHTLIPEWVSELSEHRDFSVSMLRRAKRSKQFRDMVLMEVVFQQEARARKAVH